jgi:hypothetical protein
LHQAQQGSRVNPMKRLAGVILLLILIPQIADAAWWQPNTWRFFNRQEKTITTPQAAEIEILKREIEVLKKQNQAASPKTQIQTSEARITVQKTQSADNSNQGELRYKTILDKYTALKELAKRDTEIIRENASLTTIQSRRIEYIEELIDNLNIDIDELNSVKSIFPKPVTVLDLYAPKIARIVEDYNYKKRVYAQAIISETKAKEAAECEVAQGKLEAINTAISVARTGPNERLTKLLNDKKVITASVRTLCIQD